MEDRLSAIARRSLSADSGERIHWIAHRDSGRVARVFEKALPRTGKRRTLRVKQFPGESVPEDVLADLIEEDRAQGFVADPVLTTEECSRIIRGSGLTERDIPMQPVRVTTPSRLPPREMRDWARTLRRREERRLSGHTMGRNLLACLETGLYPGNLDVIPGDLSVLILAFVEDRTAETDDQGFFQRDPFDGSLPPPHHPVFRVWGIQKAMAQAWSDPIRHRAII